MIENRPSIGRDPAEVKPIKRVFSEEKLRALVLKRMRSVFIPSSVYRIQLNCDFTFKHAKNIVPYLKELGIEAVYCSPYFQAASGSMHGYNICLLYTSDAADDLLCVDLGGRRIIKKKK